jgi:tetratricopeptide (TPR) repeat protein
MSNERENVNINEAVNNFIQKNRKAIFVSIGLIALAAAVFITALGVRDGVRKKAIARMEELNRRYEALRFDINEESKEAELAELLFDLQAFAEKSSGYAGGRAWSIIGGIHADRKEWSGAEEAYTSAAKAAAKTHLAPVAYFNAAAAAEEQGNFAAAAELYTQAVAQSSVFPAASRAQFAVGRMREALENREAALEAYRGVVAGWPSDTVWTNLAWSRIIFLESGGESEETADAVPAADEESDQ